MLRHEENERLVRVGPGTPAGELFRRYWQPAAARRGSAGARRRRRCGFGSSARTSSPSATRRAGSGWSMPIARHRRAPLFFGRNEECGLRCVYHGWKFDVTGACLDIPSEPADTPMRAGAQLKSYPTVERGGVVWAYLGPADRRRPSPTMNGPARPRPTAPSRRPIRRPTISRGSRAGSTPRMCRISTTTAWATATISSPATARRASTCTRPITAITMSRTAGWMPSARCADRPICPAVPADAAQHHADGARRECPRAAL